MDKKSAMLVSGARSHVPSSRFAPCEAMESRRLLSAVPAPLLSADIGTPAGGSANYVAQSKSFTVVGAGNDLFGAADAFHFVYEPFTGNGSFIVRVLNDSANGGHSLAGLDIRSSLSPSAANLFLGARDDGSVFVNDRTLDGISAGNLNPGQAGTMGEYLKITRSGTTVSASVSSDGVSFTELARNTIVLPATALVGIAVASQTAPTALATANFDQFAIFGTLSLDEQNLQEDLKTLVADSAAALKSAVVDAKILATDLNRLKASQSDKLLLSTLTKDERTKLVKLKTDVQLLNAALTKDSRAIAADAKILLKHPTTSATQSKLKLDIAKLQADNASRQTVASEAADANTAAQIALNALASANAADALTVADINRWKIDSARIPVTLNTDLNAINTAGTAIVTDLAG